MEGSLSDRDAEVHSELEVIKSMIAKARESTADNSVYLIVWGWLAFAGSLATYAFVYFRLYGLIWTAWAGVVGLGVMSNIALHRRSGKGTQAKTYVGDALQNLWIACGVAMTIMGFVGSISPNVSYKPLFPVISIIVGIGLFTTGGIVDWKVLRMGGVLWWAGAILMMFVPVTFHPLIMAVIVIPGYLVPGYLLRSEYKRVSQYD
jgi:hypothetical protein